MTPTAIAQRIADAYENTACRTASEEAKLDEAAQWFVKYKSLRPDQRAFVARLLREKGIS